jgi:hypothetical protein
MLSRAKSALDSEEKEAVPEKKQAPKLDNFIRDRDYMGAITLLEVRRATTDNSFSSLWERMNLIYNCGWRILLFILVIIRNLWR